MPIDPTIINLFRSHAANILEVTPIDQPVLQHDVKRWREGLVQSQEATQALNSVIEFLGGTLSITRQNVFQAAAAQMSPQVRFLMQMIWGYVPTDGRAPTRVIGYFQSPLIKDEFQLAEIFTQIADWNLREAFFRLSAVNGLSTSYITKTLYFESKPLANAAQTYAVIMDDRVSSSLVRITSPWAANCVTVSTPRASINERLGPRAKENRLNNTWQSYWTFVTGCHEIANALGTEADHIEYFLFKYEG